MDSPLHSNSSSFLAKDLEFWMTNLPQKLRGIPVIHLAIPGSHDSGTSAISRSSQLSPDAEPLVQTLRFLGPILRAFVSRWGKTQIFDISEQLRSGVRYFDLRVATKEGEGGFYFVHGLYSSEVGDGLEEMKEFLDTHPREIIILDFQHFYVLKPTDHQKLMLLITSTFAHKLLPYTPHMEHISLEYMTTQFRYQVIVVYRSEAARFGQPLLWPAASFPTPWPETDSIPKLIACLERGVRNRSFSVGYVSQCVLTPTSWFVAKHLFGTLKSKCVIPLEKQKYQWLSKQRPGLGGLNIVISDFVDHTDCVFVREVIGLNEKLLNQSNGASTPLTPVE